MAGGFARAVNRYKSKATQGGKRMNDQRAPHAQTIELLSHRRSAPPLTMTGPGPDAQQLETLLTIAARTPDQGKLAPWRFSVGDGQARARAGDVFARAFAARHPEAGAEQLEVERKRFQHAPLVIAIVSTAREPVKLPEWEQALSAGAVCMNLTVATAAMGFVSAWLTQWISYDAQVLEELGVRAGEKVAGYIHIGLPTTTIEDRPRPALADIVTRF